ncbi:MAG: hypothetical protein ACI3Z8_01890 [Paludibacteraceae bacterium]
MLQIRGDFGTGSERFRGGTGEESERNREGFRMGLERVVFRQGGRRIRRGLYAKFGTFASGAEEEGRGMYATERRKAFFGELGERLAYVKKKW